MTELNAGRATVLLDAHRELGAKLIDFGGWEMPLQYTGVIAEHQAVRTGAGLFDVSHLGKLRLTGTAGGEALQRAVTADVLALEPGRATYSLVLTESAGTIDDIFVYRIGDEEWLVVPNASNVHAVADAIRSAGGDPVDEWDRYTILALQGPDSFEVFEKAFAGTNATEMKLYSWGPMDMFGADGLIARTGYTGEKGFELYAPIEVAVKVFDALLGAGATPVGLGARDTLRLEMGYALYGHELGLDINPLEAGLGWALAWETPFVGREALEKVRADGPARKLFGIVCTDKGVPRQGYPVLAGESVIGELTSGNHSPSLGTGIALALGPAASLPAPGDRVAIEARGRLIQGDIVKPPFYRRPGSK
ncbi:MAG: aminomethyltransferase [Actinomycetota bacterium]|nr:aminomethyltransferase [Actinomycetota bacterium]